MRRVLCTILVSLVPGSFVFSQSLEHRPSAPSSATPQTIALTLPAGTPLQVALDKETRIRKVGQPIHGKVVEPAYAFDKLVVPVGSEVNGTVVALKSVSGRRRTMAAINGNFTPYRGVEVQFNELVLPDGRRISMQTSVLPGSTGVLQFASATSKETEKKHNRAEKVASEQVAAKKEAIKHDWENAKKQITEPGKMHRLGRFVQALLPVHPQYMTAGTRFNAELKSPLDFGSEPLTPGLVSGVGTPPPDGSIVHAMLLTPLSSATSKKDALVEAVITEPLFVSARLILPQGSKLEGAVLDARPARRFARTGQLRIVFHQVVPPNGLEQRVEASLEGVEAQKDGGNRLKLDSEGGAEVAPPKSRYTTTAISIALAATSFDNDIDKGVAEHPGGTFGSRTANGGSGIGWAGMALGALVHSRVLASTMGIYGAATTVYARFIARGSDVVYPKNTMMAIGIGTRAPHPAKPAESPAPRPGNNPLETMPLPRSR